MPTLSKELIVIIVESVVLAAVVIALIVLLAQKNKKKKASKYSVYVKDGVRYTYKDDTHTADGGVAVSHKEGDIVLEKGITYVVSKDGKIIPGKYSVLAAQDATADFNLRLGDFVREYKHDTDIVLKEGETICAVSHSVILR